MSQRRNTTTDPQRLGHVIQSARLQANLSLRELARRSRISVGHLSRIEAGDSQRPNPEFLQRLAHVLNLDIEVLYTFAGYTIADRLPALAPYLRAKYGLPTHAINELEDFFDYLHHKYGSNDEPSADDDSSTPR